MSIKDVSKLLEIFFREGQYHFDNKDLSSNFARNLKGVLKKALAAYCAQSPTSPDVNVALSLLQCPLDAKELTD